MNSTKALSLIYDIAHEELGPEDAKKTVSGVLISVINELEAAKVPVSEDSLNKSLSFIADRFARAAGRLAS
jgi:hypothetical protein